MNTKIDRKLHKMKGLVSRQTLSNLKSNTMKNTHKGSYFFVKNKSSLPKSCDCILFKLLLPFERANYKWHITKKNIILMDCYKQNLSRDEKTRTSDLHVPNVARYQLCYIPMRIRELPSFRASLISASAKVAFFSFIQVLFETWLYVEGALSLLYALFPCTNLISYNS